MSDHEMLSKLYLELANVVPKDTFSSKELQQRAWIRDWYSRVPQDERFSADLDGGIVQDRDGPWVIRSQVDVALGFQPGERRVNAEPTGAHVHAWVLLGPDGWDGYKELKLSDANPNQDKGRKLAPDFAWHPLAIVGTKP